MFMVGSAFAAEGVDYAYIEDFELTEAMLGNNNVRRDVKCHFQNYVSAWQVNFTYPEGITCRGFVKGSDLTLTYLDELGEQQTITPALNKNADNTRCIVAQTEGAYDEDGNYMGAAQWAPGDYAQMWIVVLNIAANFQGGDITMISAMSSSGWNGGTTPEANTTKTTVCHITLPGGNTEALTADITIGDPEGLFVPITVANVNDEAAVITVTVGGEAATIENGGVTLPAWNTDYEIVVTVTAAGEGYEGTVSKNKTVNAGEEPVTACNIVWTAVDGVLTVDVESETGAVEHLYMGRAEVAIPYSTTYDIYEGYGPVTFTATAKVDGKAMGTDEEEVKVDPVQKKDFTGDITISDPDENGVVTITYDGDEDYNLVVTVDGEPAQVVNGTVTVDEGDHTIVATISAEGYNDKSETAMVNYTAPELPQCHAPNGAYTITGFETATVTLTNNEPGATVYYDVYFNGELVPELSGSFTGDDYSFTVTGDGHYEIVAVAKMQGYKDSTPGGVFFDVQENEVPTGISELVNGKQIANVRYFNLAGQEMQEANGMTIVVTTYTDGTTSAAKVMK